MSDKTALKQATKAQAAAVTMLAQQHQNAKAARRIHVAEALSSQMHGYVMGVHSCGLPLAAKELQEIWDTESGGA